MRQLTILHYEDGVSCSFHYYYSSRNPGRFMHMIAKGQMNCPKGASVSAAEQFYSLAA